jgi:dUTP pyrophosphatase
MQVKIINKSNNPNPSFSTEGSAGVDLRAFIDEEIIVKPLERVMVPTGLFIELPKGTEAQIRPRSGLSAKYGITVLNSPGTIDSDFRGEIKVILVNLSSEDFKISNGDRVCQMVISKYEKFTWEDISEITQTNRGSGGFGHTGVK